MGNRGVLTTLNILYHLRGSCSPRLVPNKIETALTRDQQIVLLVISFPGLGMMADKKEDSSIAEVPPSEFDVFTNAILQKLRTKRLSPNDDNRTVARVMMNYREESKMSKAPSDSSAATMIPPESHPALHTSSMSTKSKTIQSSQHPDDAVQTVSGSEESDEGMPVSDSEESDEDLPSTEGQNLVHEVLGLANVNGKRSQTSLENSSTSDARLQKRRRGNG